VGVRDREERGERGSERKREEREREKRKRGERGKGKDILRSSLAERKMLSLVGQKETR
jgi:hypothetical protein